MKKHPHLILLASTALALASCSSPFKPTQSPVMESIRTRAASAGLIQGPNGTLMRGAALAQPVSPAVQFYQGG
jgi:hypothetical protein